MVEVRNNLTSWLRSALQAICLALILLFCCASTAAAGEEDADVQKFQLLQDELGEVRDFPLNDEQRNHLDALQEYQFASLRLSQGKYGDALKLFEKALAIEPDNAMFQLSTIETLALLRRSDEALTRVTALIERKPEWAELYLLRGSLLEESFERQRALNAREKGPERIPVGRELLDALETYEQGVERNPANLELLKALGNLRYKIRDYDGAIQAFEEIVQHDGRDVYPFYMLGIMHQFKALALEGQSGEEARQELEEHLRQAAKNFEACLNLREGLKDFYTRLGKIYEQLNDIETAHSVYLRALRIFPNDIGFQTRFEQTLPEGLSELNAYRELMQSAPENLMLMELYAEMAIKAGEAQEAERIYRILVEEYSSDPGHYLKLGALLLQGKQFDEAIPLYETALMLDKDSTDATVGLGEAYFGKEQYDKAAELYRQALETSQDRASIYSRLLECYSRTDQLDQAIDIINQFTNDFGHRYHIRQMLGDLYLRNQQYDEAIQEYEQALAENTGDMRNYEKLLQLFLLTGNTGKLNTLIDMGRGQFTEKPAEFERNIGDFYLAAQRYDKAAEWYEQALKSEPDNLSLLINLANTYSALDRSERFEELARRIPELSERASLGQIVLGDVLYQHGDYVKAEKAYRKAMRELEAEKGGKRDDGQRLMLYNALIQCLTQQNKDGEAEKLAQELSERFGEEFGREVEWAECRMLAAQGRYAEAVAKVRALIGQYGESQQMCFSLAHWLHMCGDLAGAEEMYRKTIEMNPRHYEAYNALGYMFAEENIRLDEAEELIKHAQKMQPWAGHIMDSLGWVYYQQGRYEEAVSWLERAVDSSARDSVLFDHLGDAYSKLGRNADAINAWRQSLQYQPENPQEIQSKIDHVNLSSAPESARAAQGK
ncbi:tetratricopeptide repeat protein [Candidatus Sumerlaeota bacterium]|nr:tetratricopeptide repeat protein [Candidatus Sumerlaeota bacterium]